MTFLLTQPILALWNLINSRIDAYKILKNKTIAHWLNFGIYILVTGLLCWGFKFSLRFTNTWIPIPYGDSVLVFASAFFNRQFSFDIPLNLRRGLDWYYQTQATGPKASLLDQIERFVFGYSSTVGVKIAIIYGLIYANIVAFYFYT